MFQGKTNSALQLLTQRITHWRPRGKPKLDTCKVLDVLKAKYPPPQPAQLESTMTLAHPKLTQLYLNAN